MDKRVSIVKCCSYEKRIVRTAIETSLKNINFSFKKGMRVLIKPNLLSSNSPEKAVTTHPVILEELCKILKKYNAKTYIGDSSAIDTDKALKVCGIQRLSKYAEIINFEGQDKEYFDFDKNTPSIPLPKILFDVDLVINVAKMKTHSFTHVTLCVKNLYGCIPGRLKERYHQVLRTPKEFSQLLVKLENKIKPELNIIDGILGMEGEGPAASGKPIKSKLLIVSKNPYAADIIASEIMGFNPYEIYTNKFSKIKKEDIQVIGNGKNIRLDFKKPSTSTIPFFISLTRLFPQSKIMFNYKNCRRCHDCEKKCPVKAIKLEPFPKCDHQKCIRCLCCMEVCKYNAIYLKENWIRNILKSILKKIFYILLPRKPSS